MEPQEMKNQAKLYAEVLEIQAKRPQLIKESEQKIAKLRKEIEQLESDNAQEMLTKLTPKKFFFKKSEPIDISDLVLKKELEIRKEEKEIEGLQNAKITNLVNLDEIVKEAQDILNKQKNVLDNIKNEIIDTQNKYHSLLDQYNNEIKNYNTFSSKVNSTIISFKKENFTPRYAGEQPSGDSRLTTLSMASEIISGHRQRPDRVGNIHY
ncbi:hypothetical protein MKX83_02950 [Cytobacillus sp. FSL M8-0252]|uniref:hypothetical protein n=1 Tax=Cytobacillus sp. FSL M8-0252 TaxID=2921621 RepID=UPI0030F53059